MKDSHYALKSIPELRWVERLTLVMDNLFRIPGTRLRFGIDPLIGLLPVLGDLISFAVSGLMVLAMVRHGISGKVALMMIGNIVLDFLIGGVAVVGDLLDFGLKANSRNLKLLKTHWEEGKHQGNGWGMVVIFGVLLLVLGVLLIYGIWSLLSWGIGSLAG